MKYTYLVHGAGRQGLAAVYDLLKRCEAKEVRVYDPSAEARANAVTRLEELCPGEPWLVGRDPDYTDVDVILSCAPYFANPALTAEAIERKIHFCDLGGNPEVVKQQAAMAESVETAVVPECGVSPGLSNILAVHMARQGAKEIEVRCGGIPVDPTINELGYKLVFSAEGLLSEYTGKVPVIEDGEIGYVDALGTIVTWDGSLEESPTSNNAPEVVETLLSHGVENYNYKTLRHPGHWTAMRGIMALGVTREQLVDMLNSCEALQYDPETDTDRLILEVTGTRFDGITTSWEYSIDLEADPKTRFSAMELMTSWGITMVAHQIAGCNPVPGFPTSVVPGFWTPEKNVDHHRIVRDLNRRLVEHDA